VRKVEGPLRTILYSREKEKHRSELLYWKIKFRKEQGKVVDEGYMKRREFAEIIEE